MHDRAFAPADPIYSNTGAMKWGILHGEGTTGGKSRTSASRNLVQLLASAQDEAREAKFLHVVVDYCMCLEQRWQPLD
jgi:hypothetical protein